VSGAAPAPGLPQHVATIREQPAGWPVPALTHPQWRSRFPWLVQGTTVRGPEEPFDLGLFGAVPTSLAHSRWRALRDAAGCPRAVHARQVHQATVLMHEAPPPAGLLVADDADGHATRLPGTLLTVSVADCVPVSVVDPEGRAIAMLHAGWRGAAAGVLEAGIALLAAAAGSAAAALHVHLGPAICGACYEVGPEVPRQLGVDAGAAGDGRSRIDVRAALAARAITAGVPAAHVTVSEHCTRCGDGFFSHRAGDAGRQMGFLGIADPAPG
jgi:polyphenol oxidase